MKSKSWYVYGVGMSLMLACSSPAHRSARHEAHDEHGAEESEEGVIVFGKAMQEAAGLRTQSVQPEDFQESIRVSGQVTEAQGDETAVVAKSAGVLTFTRDHMSEGIVIGRGEVFARVSGRGIVGGDAVAQRGVELQRAKAAFERASRLVGEGIVSQKEYEQTKAEYEAAQLASTTGAGASGTAVASPIQGYIKRVVVRQGEYVEVGQLVATITKNCNLQLRAEVPEKYFNRMRSVTGAHFAMSYDSERVYCVDSLNGHMVSMGRTATEGSAYIPVTFEFENHGDLVPGSFADIWLLGGVRSGVLSVPVGAITEEQGLHFVYVQGHCADEYEKREVKLGASNGRKVEIVAGIKAGEKVVVEGVYSLKIAGASGAVPDAHNH